MKKLLKISFLILVLGLAFSRSLAALEAGEACPQLVLNRLEGGFFNFSELLGKKPLLIWLSNFSEKDQDALPRLISLYGGKEIEFLIISVNGADLTLPQQAMQSYFIPFPVLIDPDGGSVGKLSGFYIKGVVPVRNLFLMGRDQKVKMADNFPGIPFKVLEQKLKELKAQ